METRRRASIINIDEAEENNNCVLTYGHFSTIHPGHIRYLNQAKNNSQIVYVALMGDEGEEKFIYEQKERAEALCCIDGIDKIVLLKKDELTKAVAIVKPKSLVLGNEFKDIPKYSEALRKQKELGGEIRFHAGEIQYETADLLTSSGGDLKDKRIKLFKEACKRQGLNKRKIKESIQKLKKAKIIVIGDMIVDEYAACEAIGMSAEAPVVVVKELKTKEFLGGAGIVAAHVRALGAYCDLISIVGNDSTGRVVKEKIEENRIRSRIIVDDSRPTTYKKRYIVGNQKLFRVSRLEEKNIDSDLEEKIINELRQGAVNADGIIVSDFVYGVVTDRILGEVCRLAKKHDIKLFGDLQCSSQVGSIARFKEFTLLCPNEKEARLALQDKDSGLEQISRKLIKITNTKSLVMKLGSEGFIAYDDMTGDENKKKSEAFPALSINPLDVTGAGDSLLAVMAAGISSGVELMHMAAVGCCMTALAVETMGNTPIANDALDKKIEEVLK